MEKTAFSAFTQGVVKDGEFSVTGAFADGFMKLPIGSTAGSLFEYNFNTITGKTSSHNIFDGTKSIREASIETGSSFLFGKKTNYFSKYLTDPTSKTIGEMTLEFSNQIGNYGLQKGLQNRLNGNDEDEN